MPAVNRRSFLKTAALGGGALAFASTFSAAATKHKRPNIVLIMADDLGYECLGCYGAADYQTPVLDGLARTGVRFENCHAQPLCTPSRAQIMTGRYNQRNYEGFGYLNPREITFGNLLQDAGYRTCIAGKWQLCGDAATVRCFGFEEHCLWNMHDYRADAPSAHEPEPWRRRYKAPTLYTNGRWTEYGQDAYGPDVACDFLLDFMTRHHEAPFFCYYPMILTHSPFVPTPDSADPACKDAKQNFVDMVQYMDKCVGRIVAHLDKLGLRDDTLLLFTGDNGTHVSITSQVIGDKAVTGGKGMMTDAGTHVPLIVNGRGVAQPGRVCGDLVDFSDFLPTIAGATGASVPDDRVIDGRSFLPQLRGEKGYPREWIFCHYWGARGRTPEGTRESVRDTRWKLYNDGSFYDLAADLLEEAPLTQLSTEQQTAKRRLKAAFREVRSR